MQAGKYWVGDLCYVFSDKDWMDACKLFISGNDCLEGEFNLPDGRRFAIFNTAYGDGEYYDQNGHKYCVDAGCIGCTLVENISASKYNNIEDLGNIVEFNETFEVLEDQGLIKIGHILIETNDTYDDEYDEEVFEDWDKD
jgi:hypothetical protein